MSKQQPFQVAGVDGCKAGWLVAVLSAMEVSTAASIACVYKLQDFLGARTFSEILSRTTQFELICVDIPIGLSDGDKPRACDIAARKVLGWPRASSVFMPPVRQALSARNRETASKICFEHSGKKLSCQSFNILAKIREVDKEMTLQRQQRLREVHPEVSFWALNGGKPTMHKKARLIGRQERLKILSPIFSDLEDIVAKARKPKEVAPDDVLDAIVAAWTAGQAVTGKARTLPQNPELDSKGLRMEILCPDAC